MSQGIGEKKKSLGKSTEGHVLGALQKIKLILRAF